MIENNEAMRHEEKDVLEKAQAIISNIQENVLRGLSVYYRVLWLLRVLKKGSEENHIEDINWDKVNEILHYPSSEDDFDMIPDRISTVDQLDEIKEMIDLASLDIIPWKRLTCKECGSEFSLEYGEVQFYKKKGLALPKRCKNCRDFRRHERQRASADKS